MNCNFLNKKIAITGANGFVGKRLVEFLKDKKYKKIFPIKKSDFNLIKLQKVQKMYNDIEPDIVIHLAACVGGIGFNMDHPAELFYNNIMMGIHIVDEAVKYNLEKLILIGTICSYPKYTQVPFQERDLWKGYPEETNAPYGIAKKTILVQSQAYRKQYGLNSIYLMPVNLYGPGDNFNPNTSHVIPALIHKFIKAKKEKINQVVCWGTGEATREFLYIDDLVRAIWLSMEKYNEDQPMNIGSGQDISIKILAEKIAELCDFKGNIIWDTSKPDGQPQRKLDVSYAKNMIGFESQYNFNIGLKNTIEWYKKNTLTY